MLYNLNTKIVIKLRFRKVMYSFAIYKVVLTGLGGKFKRGKNTAFD